MRSRVLRLSCCGVGACIVWLLIVSVRIHMAAGAGSPTEKADVALVLGAGSSGGIPSAVFMGRIDYAVQLFQEGWVDEVLFTGGLGAGETIPDAEAARRYAIAKGVPADRILIETNSRTTRENLVEAHRLLRRKASGATCLLVSDPLHLFRASCMMNDEGIVGRPAPAITSQVRGRFPKLRFFVRELWFYHGYLLTGK